MKNFIQMKDKSVLIMKTKHLVKRNDSRSKFPSHFLPGVKLLKFYKLKSKKVCHKFELHSWRLSIYCSKFIAAENKKKKFWNSIRINIPTNMLILIHIINFKCSLHNDVENVRFCESAFEYTMK